MSSSVPEFILFMQHGWADDNRAMISLAKNLVGADIPVIAPDLGYVQTWLRIEPLIKKVEKAAAQEIARYPNVPLRIVGHSMGGLIWLEVLNRHPEWWAQVHSLVLVASPVGGADLGRLFDPLQLGLGIAADLGRNRKSIAEEIAAVVPILDIAGDIDGGSDGTITVESTRFHDARYVCLNGLSHPEMRNHPLVAETILQFWQDVTRFDPIKYDEIVRLLQAVPGMTDAHQRGFNQAKIAIYLENGGSIRTWSNLLGIDHVFVASPDDRCLYAGYVGWMHSQDLEQALVKIRQEYGITSPTP
jgi:pimeloyl-ACP methyl ester carboxylesterase